MLSGEDEPSSSAVPSADDYEEKKSEVIINTPPPVSTSPTPASPRTPFSGGASSAPAHAAVVPADRPCVGSEASSADQVRFCHVVVIVSTFSPGFDPR
ncbi:hypothetical protein GN244_ATG05969 [Phytophthora infestans]|uniref:Uncharacterized protein n=1 Tax=Phytophthora infestans TaxID=4787 RepID=A0A833TE10_PHYIN|nr:hypothetical protein GN244_ATG05969 [Phytophthora infestans]